MSAAGVRGLFTQLGIALPDRGGRNVEIRCFASPDAHRNGDRSPSASLNLETGAWCCFGCGAKGGPYDAALARGLDPRGAMEALRRFGLAEDRRDVKPAARTPTPAGAGPSPARRAPQEAAGEPDKPSWSEAQAQRYETEARAAAAALAANAAVMRRLAELRGWTPDAIRALHVGYDGERVTFPIRDAAGALVGLQRYAPNPKRRDEKRKMLAKSGGVRELFPAPESIPGDTVWLVEGEPDAVAAHSLGLPAVAIPGKSAWKSSWPPRFAHRRVVILLDCAAGSRETARVAAESLLRYASDVRVLDLDPSRDDDYDLGDELLDAAQHGPDGMIALRGLLEGMAADADPVDGPPEAAPDDEREPGRRLRFTPASEIKPERVEWLWDARVPLAAVTLLAGRQGLGKSTLTVELAARLSRGELDGDLKGEPGATLIVTYEDHPATTIVPRLIAAGADLSMVRVVELEGDGDLVSLPGDVERIAGGVHKHRARLLVVDPVVASLPAEINSHRDQDVRRALAPLAKLAQDESLSVLGLIHWNKAPGADALMRVGGSTAFTAGPRSVLAFGTDPEDPEGTGRVLAHAKCNLGPYAPSLACVIEGREVPSGDGETIPTSRLIVVGEHGATASDLLATASDEDRSELDEAADFLRECLADGEWHPKREVEAAAKSDGVSATTLKRAKSRLRIESERQGFPARASWRLTVGPSPLAQLENRDPWPNCENPAVEPKNGPPGVQLGQNRKFGPTGAKTPVSDPGTGAEKDPLREHAADPARVIDGGAS